MFVGTTANSCFESTNLQKPFSLTRRTDCAISTQPATITAHHARLIFAPLRRRRPRPDDALDFPQRNWGLPNCGSRIDLE
jgi:hypothetical protein